MEAACKFEALRTNSLGNPGYTVITLNIMTLLGGLHNSSSMWVFVFAPLFLSKTLVLNYMIFCDFYPIFLFKIHVTSKFKEKSHINPCHAEYIKMPCQLLVFSQSDYLIQLVHTNSNT